MTTESKPGTRTGLSPLLGAVGAGAVAVLVLVVVASLTDGRPAVVGAAGGGVLTLVVFALGIAVVGAVARVMPAASLLVALLTYALQLLVLALCVAAIDRAGRERRDALARLVRGRRHRRDAAVDGGPAGRCHPPADPGLRHSRPSRRWPITPGVSDDRIRC